MKVALISLPWNSPYRPSIQIGSIVAFLKQTAPDIEVAAFHDHLMFCNYMDYQQVKSITEGDYSAWLGEAISAFLLFPENSDVILKFIASLLKNKMAEQEIIRDFINPFQRFVKERVDFYIKEKFDVLGFTITFCQTFSSLLMASEIKKLNKEAFVILGGSVVSGEKVAASLLESFSSVNAIIMGEGESPLKSLLFNLSNNIPIDNINGVFTINSKPGHGLKKDQQQSMEAFTMVDYNSYFDLLPGLKEYKLIKNDLEIPVESSRGCWWNKCRFCNLSYQWQGYREKSIKKHIEEISQLVKKTGVKRFLFVDNIMRQSEEKIMVQFESIIEKFGNSLELYIESTVNFPASKLALLKAAGVLNCQLGIESLSNGVLKKIRKGSSVIKNIEAMKNLEKYNIGNPANILYDLPFVTEAEMLETLENISYVKAYYPLQVVKFFLNYGSDYYNDLLKDPEWKNTDKNYCAWNIMLPSHLRDKLFLPQREYSSKEVSDKVIRKLENACQKWTNHYWEMKSKGIDKLLQAKQNGENNSIIIEDYRNESKLSFPLSEIGSDIYHFFEHTRKITDCYEKFSTVEKKVVSDILDYLVKNKLCYIEGDKALSLAI